MWQCVTKASTVPPFHSAKMWCAMGAQRDTGNILILECVLLIVPECLYVVVNFVLQRGILVKS